jgi:formate hydrogenlyase transcriptional activator
MQSAFRPTVLDPVTSGRRGAAPVRMAEDDDLVVGVSDAMRYVMFRLDQVAATDATVLLHGETGTGKELVARALHRQSSRRQHPFVVVNCAAMPATLIESELFGRERGAFTGADTSQIGRFELANRGTIFLDEIGELSLELQPKLLRVLQEGQIDRLGSPRTIDVDVRVIAATNRDLSEEVREGRFRRDLYYRLNVFPITLPSLRQHREDIPILAQHLLNRLGRTLRRQINTIAPDVMEALQTYEWPGNVRELENVLQRAMILARGNALTSVDLSVASLDAGTISDNATLTEVERRHILRVLSNGRWRIEGPGGAAQVLGLKPSTLRSRMMKLGIVRPH